MIVEDRPRDQAETVLTRAASVSDSDLEAHRASLQGFLRDEIGATTRDDVARRAARNDLVAAVNERLITDPATKELVEKASAGAAGFKQPKRSVLRATTDWEIPLGEGITILVPPYDDSAPSAGDAATHAFKSNGRCQAFVGTDGTGFASATASLSIWISAGKTGILEVRPFVKYDYAGSVRAWALSGWSGGRVHVLISNNGTVIAERSDDLWSVQTESSEDRVDTGIVWPPDVILRLPVQNGSVYTVDLAAIAMRDQSGQPALLGYSWASSRLALEVPFITLELR